MEIQVLHGNKAIIEKLEQALEMAKSGEMEGFALVHCNKDKCSYSCYGINADMEYPHSRIVAAIDILHFRLIDGGI